ncbi:MAG: phosphoglycerate dehydrogenase [Thermoleophilaceae bacterium]|nr:phosphoglycerate dehydrogenase [Thermoleophilaceae bacterium]
MNAGQRVLVKEKIAESGVELLRRHFDVDVGVDWADGELAERIGDYDAILIRSATKLTADLIERGSRLKVIGRAGIGVDNVDLKAATKRGIIVANAPESNMVAAAEHTLALMLALCRNVPQAHASLSSGRWERSKFGGIEVYEKTLGVLGFGRIGRLVAERAKAFGMKVIAFDPFVSAERFRELGVEKAESSDEVYAAADIITLHLPKTPDTVNWLDDAAFAKMKDGVRIVNVARGELIDHAALQRALESGKVAGAALDVFPQEPITEHPLFGMPNVIVTPHLGASTVEAQDRAGVITAEQVLAALTGGEVTNAVNIPRLRPEDREALGPFMPLCTRLGRLAMSLGEASSVDRIEVRYEGRLSEFDTRLLTVAVLVGVLEGHTEESVNYVNAPALAEERGIQVAEQKRSASEDFNELVAVAVVSDGRTVEVAGTGFGPRNVPHLVSVYGQSFNLEMADHFAFFRYADQPGMIGRVGTIFGEQGVNIVSAAVGAEEGAPDAVMVVTTDAPVPQELVDRIVALDGFHDGRAVSL